jgi:hypothetical protein
MPSKAAETLFQTDPDEYLLFALALEMGMPAADLRHRLSAAEFTSWVAFLNERARREREASETALADARS